MLARKPENVRLVAPKLARGLLAGATQALRLPCGHIEGMGLWGLQALRALTLDGRVGRFLTAWSLEPRVQESSLGFRDVDDQDLAS